MAEWSTPTGSPALEDLLHLIRNSVHTGGVHESEQRPSRVSVRWLATRWVLVGTVLSGVIAMHVLGAHEAGGGHGMVIEGQQLAAGASVSEPGGTMTMSMPAAESTPAAAAELSAVVLMPAMPGGSMGAMATCVLFLVVGAATVLLALLASGSARTSISRQRWCAGLLDLSPRGPPGSGLPRISLCVLRV